MERHNSSIVIFEPVPSFFAALSKLWQTYLASGQGYRFGQSYNSWFGAPGAPRAPGAPGAPGAPRAPGAPWAPVLLPDVF